MDSKKHDLHFMTIVLILAFFVMILSINNIMPDMATGQVTYEYEQRTNFLSNLFKSQKEFNIENSNTVSDFKLNLVQSDYSIEEVDKLLAGSCDWVNLGNADYQDVRLLSGYEACIKKKYDSCVMTNKMLTTSFFNSKSGFCEGLQLEQTSNKLGSCTEKIRSATESCTFLPGDAEPRSGDYSQELMTSVLCCR